MVTIYNTTLSATSQRHFSDSLGGGNFVVLVMLYNKQRQVAEYACAA